MKCTVDCHSGRVTGGNHSLPSLPNNKRKLDNKMTLAGLLDSMYLMQLCALILFNGIKYKVNIYLFDLFFINE